MLPGPNRLRAFHQEGFGAAEQNQWSNRTQKSLKFKSTSPSYGTLRIGHPTRRHMVSAYGFGTTVSAAVGPGTARQFEPPPCFCRH